MNLVDLYTLGKISNPIFVIHCLISYRLNQLFTKKKNNNPNIIAEIEMTTDATFILLLKNWHIVEFSKFLRVYTLKQLGNDRY
jgi:hypothetical protein